jgi:hypothetical protein
VQLNHQRYSEWDRIKSDMAVSWYDAWDRIKSYMAVSW